MIDAMEAIRTAWAADHAFAEAVRSAGYRDRYHWFLAKAPAGCPVAAAYRAKLAADEAMQRAMMLRNT
jgi:hypothetical protein